MELKEFALWKLKKLKEFALGELKKLKELKELRGM